MAAGLAAAAALLAGCGGGSDQPKVVTKDNYITSADKVCANLSERFNSAAQDPQSTKEIVDSANVLGDLYDNLGSDLKKLRLPVRAADRKGASDYIAAVGQTKDFAEQLRTSAQALQDAVNSEKRAAIAKAAGDVRSALDAFRAAQVQAGQLGVAYGFTVCGSLD